MVKTILLTLFVLLCMAASVGAAEWDRRIKNRTKR